MKNGGKLQVELMRVLSLCSTQPEPNLENTGGKLYAMMEQPFDRGKTINYWLECAAYGLETGKSLLEAGRVPYV